MSMRLSELDAGRSRRRSGNVFVTLGFLAAALAIGVMIGWIIKMNGEIHKLNNDLEFLRSQIIDVRKDVKSEADRADHNIKILRDQFDALVRVLKRLP